MSQNTDRRVWCVHCQHEIFHRPGHAGRYRYTDCIDGTDIFGSGSECPKNERGHEPEDGSNNAWLAWVEQYEFEQLRRHHPELES